MWYRDNYAELFSLHQEAAETYSRENPNQRLGQTCLVATHNLHDFRIEVLRYFGGVLDDRHKMQVLYLQRGVDALFSLFWLVRHHQYTAAYGRVRFLIETYLVVRHFNRNRDKSAKKWREKLEEFKNQDTDRSEADPLTKYFDGVRRNLIGEVEDKYSWFDPVMGHLSDIGAHPQGILSMDYDSRYSKEMEKDLLEFGNIFNFSLAAQYIRVFEETEIAGKIREKLDPLFVQVMLVCPELPAYLEEDLEFGSVL